MIVTGGIITIIALLYGVRLFALYIARRTESVRPDPFQHPYGDLVELPDSGDVASSHRSERTIP